MIVKKVNNPQKTASKSIRIARLTNYIREPVLESAQEKCIYAGARGFLTDDPQSQTAEMTALSQDAVRSKDTINHYVLSWRECEQPSASQVEEAVSIFMQVLGVQVHQVIYGLHADTDNPHLHLAINRVHPDTLKAVKINSGFDIEAAHKAIARIENAQGWQRERCGRYQVLENGNVVRQHLDPDKPRAPAQKKRDMEIRTGEKSAERIAIEDGAPIINTAQTWEQLHRVLAAKGMRYEKSGRGATIFVGAVGVKASSADRQASLSRLEIRLGTYEPSKQWQMAQREPEPIMSDLPWWNEYIAGRKAHYVDENATKLALLKRHAQDRLALQAQQKSQRDAIMRYNWKGKGELLNALRSVIAAEQAAQKAALKGKHKMEREQHRRQFRPYPDLERWLQNQERPDLALQWRYRASELQGGEGYEGDCCDPPRP